jgi:hypothetical protein
MPLGYRATQSDRFILAGILLLSVAACQTKSSYWVEWMVNVHAKNSAMVSHVKMRTFSTPENCNKALDEWTEVEESAGASAPSKDSFLMICLPDGTIPNDVPPFDPGAR